MEKQFSDDRVIALVGNPNVGKSTLFNTLTGLNRHTGNWTGKTVDIEQGRYQYKGRGYILVDLPGTYSFHSNSEEEKITVDFLQACRPDCILIVADATCLPRNISFALQVMENFSSVCLCVNLMDEAAKWNMEPDLHILQKNLGIPVVGASAGIGEGLDRVRELIRNLCDGFSVSAPVQVSGRTPEAYLKAAEEISKRCLPGFESRKIQKFDRIALGKFTGPVLLFFLLMAVFWLTMVGANYPSQLLQTVFSAAEGALKNALRYFPAWLTDLFIDGIFHTTANVVSVMLPPMLIFFPLFSFLEDLGYLPRAAFLADRCFEHCGSCGKQALTMSMGFGCNAVGVMGTRIISSKRERFLAIVTNSLVPCNGRFPTLIALICLLCRNSMLSQTGLLAGLLLLSMAATLLFTKILSSAVIKGEPSTFILEIPPYRKPNIRKILSSALWEKTAFVLTRAVAVAAPTGAVVWLLQRVTVQGMPLLSYASSWLDAPASLFGLHGAIILAFILSFPANELFIPMYLLITSAPNASFEPLWPVHTLICTLIFVLFHWPCSTTCMTIRKETGSWKAVLLSALVPTVAGLSLCFLINGIVEIFGIL